MKNLKVIHLLNSFFTAAFVMILLSCEPKTPDAVEVAEDHNHAKFHNNRVKNSSGYIVDAAELLLQDIELAKMAQNNSIKNDVRKTGRQLELEYTQCYSLLKQIALKNTITVPEEVSNKNKRTDKDISYEISDRFDEKYFELAKKDHGDAITLLQKISSESKHEELKTWADSTLAIYRKNLDSITLLEQRLQLTKPNP